MSRHRLVRNLDLDEELDDGYEDEYPDDEMTEDDFASLQAGLKAVREVVRDDAPLTDKEIQDVLWDSYFDTEQTIAWALDTAAKRRKKAEQRANKKGPAAPSLRNLATRPAPSISLRGLATPSVKSPSLSDLATRSATPSLRDLATSTRTLSIRDSAGSLRPSQPSTSAGRAQPLAPTLTVTPTLPAERLVSPPSALANFLGKPPSNRAPPPPTQPHLPSQLYRDLATATCDPRRLDLPPTVLDTLIYFTPWLAADRPAAPMEVQPFTFDQPSRDDLVSQAQGGIAKPTPLPPATPPAVQEAETRMAHLDVNEPQPAPIDGIASAPLAKAAPRLNLLEAYRQREEGKPRLNLIVIGHVDAGKSTLMGHVLYLLGQVPERILQKYERDATRSGKSSFHFAWVLDATEEERSRGVTIDIATSHFETPHRIFTLLDAPGHRDFIPNMISGTAQADAAVLVVDATPGGFEAGFGDHGQTKEHALLARGLGVQQLVVAVNKLDTADWAEGRFADVRDQTAAFLVQAGFRADHLTFVPCSGLRGINLATRPDPATEASALTAWYDGPCLVEVLDGLSAPERLVDAPFRLSVTDFFRGSLTGGPTAGVAASGTTVTATGRIASGAVQVGSQLELVPGHEKGLVKALELDGETSAWAAAGDTVMLTVQGIDLTQYSIGSVLCPLQQPIPTTTTFIAQVVVFEVQVPVTQGFPVILHYQSRNEPAYISRLVAQLDKRTGEVTKKKPRHLPKSSAAKVEITTQRPICLDTFERSKTFGRVTLRKGGETIAAGIVLRLVP
ncbi:hypothetical protein IWQ60_004963 [Tieghemiomyces parasiticus]|uniref:Elongation factor 1 alpha-like protein n=1 Tax=Tieghemiomyces parasiticus TaxID=78921 RepID=A0A9W8ADA3_9FUNG|nr:hypothetical protein IWQ60_004963 [Tieghemiomyces parasiticus]